MVDKGKVTWRESLDLGELSKTCRECLELRGKAGCRVVFVLSVVKWAHAIWVTSDKCNTPTMIYEDKGKYAVEGAHHCLDAGGVLRLHKLFIEVSDHFAIRTRSRLKAMFFFKGCVIVNLPVTDPGQVGVAVGICQVEGLHSLCGEAVNCEAGEAKSKGNFTHGGWMAGD